ncbi:albusnodin family lasso peptide [Nocardiopsis sp. NPDC006832]
MRFDTSPVEESESVTVAPVVVELGDAVDLTEGTSSRSGSEDKRYKYQ